LRLLVSLTIQQEQLDSRGWIAINVPTCLWFNALPENIKADCFQILNKVLEKHTLKPTGIKCDTSSSLVLVVNLTAAVIWELSIESGAP
jgi:hypothetical protein